MSLPTKHTTAAARMVAGMLFIGVVMSACRKDETDDYPVAPPEVTAEVTVEPVELVPEEEIEPEEPEEVEEKKPTARKWRPSPLAACCSALSRNAAHAPPDQKGGYALAVGMCHSMKNNPQTGVALRALRAQLGSSLPASCS